MPATLDAPLAPPADPPKPTTQINVSQMPQSTTPTEAPKPGSARERLRADLQKVADKRAAPPVATQRAEAPKGGKPVAQAAPPSTDASQAPSPYKTVPEPKGEPDETRADDPQQPQAEPQTAPPGTKKESPWKLMDQYKNLLSQREKEIADLRSSIVPEQERKAITEKLTKAEARAKELEDEIRYVNYEKSDEFKTKYQEPYEKAWQNATREFADLTVTDANGNQRLATGDDIMQVVNLPLAQAREVANNLFGDFADDVMGHRKEIRKLFDARQEALTEAKKNGEARQKEVLETQQRQYQQLNEQISQVWKTSGEALLKDPKWSKYFTPVEGDQDGNQRLAKGLEMVERAFTEDARDPRLTPEQRATIIKRHAAVKYRAAAFGRLVALNDRLETQINELKKELEQYKQAEPNLEGSAPSTAPATPRSARERLFGELAKIAR